MIERYHESALTRWLEATFGPDLVGVVVLGVPAVLGLLLWLVLHRAARDRE